MSNSFRNGKQVPFPLVEGGKAYEHDLLSRSQAILNALINLTASNYKSTVLGPNYTIYMKAMATELARITIILETLGKDISPDEVLSEFLWQSVGYLVFLNQKVPELEFDDESFREFLRRIVDIYFEGATPAAIRKGVEMFSTGKFVVRENFKENTKDISTHFGFTIDFELDNAFPPDMFVADRNIRLLLEIIRPAHTLYSLRHVFKEEVPSSDWADSSSWFLYDYHYDDARSFCDGLAGFTSASGFVLKSNTSVLYDEDTSKPLHKVNVGATLTIPKGPNAGAYRIKDKGAVKDSSGVVTRSWVRTHPRLKEEETDVYYEVEIDSKGRKRELYVEETVKPFNKLL